MVIIKGKIFVRRRNVSYKSSADTTYIKGSMKILRTLNTTFILLHFIQLYLYHITELYILTIKIIQIEFKCVDQKCIDLLATE